MIMLHVSARGNGREGLPVRRAMPLLRGRYSGSVARTWRFYIGFRAGYSTTCDIETLSISGHAVTRLTNHTADDTGRPFVAHRLHVPIVTPASPPRVAANGTSGTYIANLMGLHTAHWTLHRDQHRDHENDAQQLDDAALVSRRFQWASPSRPDKRPDSHLFPYVTVSPGGTI